MSHPPLSSAGSTGAAGLPLLQLDLAYHALFQSYEHFSNLTRYTKHLTNYSNHLIDICMSGCDAGLAERIEIETSRSFLEHGLCFSTFLLLFSSMSLTARRVIVFHSGSLCLELSISTRAFPRVAASPLRLQSVRSAAIGSTRPVRLVSARRCESAASHEGEMRSDRRHHDAT